ncbi:LHFPL tetraspan subfamily member 4 protein [Holothuria leucospilota]|uniref:LHFPL tetraspan subfamily member 4 protein n=1 Tax=Holothuria leucospilota TaxID=206669 RepID=A0A9Q1CJU6_HOLLE|nr:LHFPL tetraspan subfamily member 4 protein [Holothuria leucospilota]
MAKERKENAYAYSYHTNYIRNARAIAIAWGIFTFCFAIIMIILFVEPSWMYGATQRIGSFGLWQYCPGPSSTNFQSECSNDLWPGGTGAGTYPGDNSLIKAASILILIAVILVGLSILCMLLFLCKRPTTPTVFMIAGTLQILCGVLVFLGVVVFAAGKRNPVGGDIQTVCGPDGDNCTIGWAFILAIVAILDAIALGILAFILAVKQEKLETDMTYSDYSRPNGSTTGRDYGTVNSSIFKTHSRSSLNSNSNVRRNGSMRSDSRRSTGSGESDAEIAMDAIKHNGSSEPAYASVTPKSERKSTGPSGEAGSVGSTRSRGTPKSSRRSSSPHDVVL